jgi:hypothetical protein
MEGVPEIRCDVFVVWIGTVTGDCGFVAIPVPQLRRSRIPVAVVESNLPPERTLIRTIVQLFPRRPRGNEDGLPGSRLCGADRQRGQEQHDRDKPGDSFNQRYPPPFHLSYRQ